MTLAEFRAALERDGVPFEHVPPGPARADHADAAARARGRRQDPGERQRDRSVPRGDEAAPGERAEYNLAHILVRVPEQASPEQVEAARGASSRRSPKRAAAATSRSSPRPIPTRPRRCRAARSAGARTTACPSCSPRRWRRMKPGDVSARCAARRASTCSSSSTGAAGGASDAPIPQTRLRHILIRTSETVSETEARRRLTDLRRAHRRAGAPISPRWRACTRTTRTAARGGELDWVYPGDTVPDFERAYQELQIGEVSEPVRTPFGVPPHPGARAALRRHEPRAAAPAGAPGAARAQGRRGVPASGCASCATTTYVELRLEER